MKVLTSYSPKLEDVKKAAMETEAKITSGELHPFQGPITKQDGTVAAKEGETVAIGDMLGMNWYVKGIDDKLPN